VAQVPVGEGEGCQDTQMQKHGRRLEFARCVTWRIQRIVKIVAVAVARVIGDHPGTLEIAQVGTVACGAGGGGRHRDGTDQRNKKPTQHFLVNVWNVQSISNSFNRGIYIEYYINTFKNASKQ